MNGLGFDVGKSMYKRVADFLASGDIVYSTPDENFPGRKRHKAAEQVADHWIEATQPLSRLNSKGESLRVAHGGRGKLALEITEAYSCSKSTAYRYCPETVVPTKKSSDLCMFCEGLRKARLECISIANAHGANLQEPHQFAGQADIAGQVKAAETFLGNMEGAPQVQRLRLIEKTGRSPLFFLGTLTWGTPAKRPRPVFVLRAKQCVRKNKNAQVAEVRRMISVLSGHEATGAEIAAKMKNEYGRCLVACFDYSGALLLQSFRGDAQEFFSPISLSLFGIMFVAPTPDGGFCHRYIDVFSFEKNHTSEVAAASLRRGVALATELEFISGVENGTSWYSDKAKHFCSGEMAYDVLFDVSKHAQNVSYTYHACYHGKTALDGHFARLKEQIKLIVVDKWPRDKVEIEALITSAAGQLKNTGVAFLKDFARKEQKKELIIPNISCVQTLRRKTHPETLQDTLVVENRAIPIRVKNTQRSTREPTGEVSPFAPGGCFSANLSVLCDKLEKQQCKLDSYRNWQ